MTEEVEEPQIAFYRASVFCPVQYAPIANGFFEAFEKGPNNLSVALYEHGAEDVSTATWLSCGWTIKADDPIVAVKLAADGDADSLGALALEGVDPAQAAATFAAMHVIFTPSYGERIDAKAAFQAALDDTTNGKPVLRPVITEIPEPSEEVKTAQAMARLLENMKSGSASTFRDLIASAVGQAQGDAATPAANVAGVQAAMNQIFGLSDEDYT